MRSWPADHRGADDVRAVIARTSAGGPAADVWSLAGFFAIPQGDATAIPIVVLAVDSVDSWGFELDACGPTGWKAIAVGAEGSTL